MSSSVSSSVSTISVVSKEFLPQEWKGKTIELLSSKKLIPNLCTDISLNILSYIGSYRDFTALLGAHKVANQFEGWIFSQIQIFDRGHWEKYYGVKVTNQFDADKIDMRIRRDFLRTYYGPNPIGTGLVKDNCLIPTVRPQYVDSGKYCLRIVNRIFGKSNFCLRKLGELAEHPNIGHAAKYYWYPMEALKQHGTTKAESPRLVILLKGVVARNKPWSNESQNPA